MSQRLNTPPTIATASSGSMSRTIQQMQQQIEAQSQQMLAQNQQIMAQSQQLETQSQQVTRLMRLVNRRPDSVPYQRALVGRNNAMTVITLITL